MVTNINKGREDYQGELWIARFLPLPERLYYIYHEMLEYSKMLMGLNYDTAHVMANKAEGRLRHIGDLKEVDRLIKRMMVINKDIMTDPSICNGLTAIHKDGAAHHAHHHKRHHTEGIRRSKPSGLVTMRS